MGQETEDSQKPRRIAAAAYDYDNDPRWADYWSNILIPPHLSSRSDVLDHYKRKFYQRYIVRTPLFLYSFPSHFYWFWLLILGFLGFGIVGFKWVLFVFGFVSVIGSTIFLILGYAYQPNIKVWILVEIVNGFGIFCCSVWNFGF